MATKIIYKKYAFENCVIRYPENNMQDMYRKFKGGEEHKTSPRESKLAADAVLEGKLITKEEYENY